MIDEKALALLRRMDGSQVCRFSDLLSTVSNPRTLSAKLRMLGDGGLVVKEGGLYHATGKGIKAASLLGEFEELMRKGEGFQGFKRVPHSLYHPLLRDYCELLSASYGERLEGVVLFGSVARGDWTKVSDIDLLVVVDGWESLGDRARLEELSAAKGRLAGYRSHAEAVRNGFAPAIHELPLVPAELREFRTVYLDIALDGIVLFDRTGKLKDFVRETRAKAGAAGSRRVVSPDGAFYWVLARPRPGEVVELGIKL
ncbi:MAG: nucleotidyltransferase domain-containing protein [Nitrososphaerota archaeon]|nr:nucleotidyltransferase domain-containing protein [Nitrososphaerota archaeon]